MKHLAKILLAIALLLCVAPGARAQDFLPYPGIPAASRW